MDGFFHTFWVFQYPDKLTTKVKRVYDGYAKCEEKSLNDVIHQVKKLQQDLMNVLLRFKRHPTALTRLIAEINSIIGIHPIDQPYQRILWRTLKIVFGINFSPIHAYFVSLEHAKKKRPELPEAKETVFFPTYIDYSMDSKGNNAEGIRIYQDLSKSWRIAGMYATK